jgi:CTP:molybdopterin cytidylyltransferase MocA
VNAAASGAFGVILAAGRSRRLGRPKALLPFQGQPLVQALVETYQSVGLKVVVVAGPEVARVLEPTSVQLTSGDPEQVMIDSLARGLAAGPVGARAALIQPVDAAFTDRALLLALLQAVTDRAVVPHHAGVPGHPVALPASYFPAIAERPEGGLRTLLGDAVALDWGDPRILCDLDEPADLVRWGLATS